MDMPDRELDALVSEKVMGLHIYSHTWPCGYEPECGCYEAASIGASREYAWHNENGPVFIDQDCDGDIPWLEPVPFYSTDIATAWQVVEKMTEHVELEYDFEWQGPIFKPSHDYLTSEGFPLGTTCWYVYIEKAGYREWVCADSAPRAICLAALKALGVEVDDGR